MASPAPRRRVQVDTTLDKGGAAAGGSVLPVPVYWHSVDPQPELAFSAVLPSHNFFEYRVRAPPAPRVAAPLLPPCRVKLLTLRAQCRAAPCSAHRSGSAQSSARSRRRRRATLSCGSSRPPRSCTRRRCRGSAACTGPRTCTGSRTCTRWRRNPSWPTRSRRRGAACACPRTRRCSLSRATGSLTAGRRWSVACDSGAARGGCVWKLTHAVRAFPSVPTPARAHV